MTNSLNFKTSPETCVGPLSPHIHCNVESQLPAKAALVNSKSSSSSWIKIHGNVRTWSVKNNEWLHTMLDYFNQGCRVFKLRYISIIYLSSKESFSQTVKQVTTKCRVWQLKQIFFKEKRKYILFGLFYYDIFFVSCTVGTHITFKRINLKEALQNKFCFEKSMLKMRHVTKWNVFL